MKPVSTRDPVTAYRRNLPLGELIDFPYTALDRLGIPVYSTALWPEGGVFCNGLGYGTTEPEAEIGAFGELAEVAAAHRALPEMVRTRGSYRELVAWNGEGHVLDPIQACLEAGSDYDHDRVLDWVEARRYPDGEMVLVPVDLAASRFADFRPDEQREERLLTPITNGHGAGLSFEHALSHGILELVQRDGNSVNFRALDRGVAIDLDSAADPETRALLEHLDAEGVEVVAKLAATDLGMANLYVVGADRDSGRSAHPIMASACGEAAHPSRERALRKALLEFVAARARKLFNHGPLERIAEVSPPGYIERFRNRPLGSEEDRSLYAMLHWLSLSYEELRELLRDPVLTVRSRVAFSDLPDTEFDPDPGSTALLDFVVDRLAEAGLDVLYVDFSSPGSGVYAVKAIVPGLEVETMSYGRIGHRNLRRLLDRNSNLVCTGSPPSGGARILLPEREEKELGPAWLDREAVDRAVGKLYPLYREPGRHVAALAAERKLA